MCPHSPCEICGFWMTFCGWASLLVQCLCLIGPEHWHERLTAWMERRLRISWYAQIALSMIGLLLLAIGMHLLCLGGRGRYPGYPLDLFLAR